MKFARYSTSLEVSSPTGRIHSGGNENPYWNRICIRKGVRDTAPNVQTYSSGVSEMNCVGIFDGPPLIHPIDSVSRSTRRVNRVSRGKFSGGGVIPEEL